MITLQSAPPAATPRGGSDNSHFYGHTLEAGWYPLYTADKPYGLREARKDKAAGGVVVPSSTTILGSVKKRQVDEYNKKNAARAAITIKRDDYPDEAAWLDAVLDMADTASNPAKKLGSQIHAAIELAVGGKDYDAAMDIYVRAVMNERNVWGLRSIAQEKCVGNLAYGYGGKADDFCEGMIAADYKSRGKAEDYPQDWSQVASYGYAEWGNDFFLKGAGIIFPISTKQPGLVKPVMKPGKDLVQAFEGFIGLTAWWRTDHNFDPRVK